MATARADYGMVRIPTPTILSELRARRLARRLIEAQERLDGDAGRIDPLDGAEREALRATRDRLIERLEAAAARLGPDDLLRRRVEDALRVFVDDGVDPSRPEAAKRRQAALRAIEDAMRRTSLALLPRLASR
jgi:hypothetical protein